MKQDFAPLDNAILSALKHGAMTLDELYGTELICHHCWRLRNQRALKTGNFLAADSFLSGRLKVLKDSGKIYFPNGEGWQLCQPQVSKQPNNLASTLKE